MKNQRIIHLAVIFVPLLAIAGWIGSYMMHVANSATYELAIRGFDPRDLLSGHYLRYQVDYGMPITCEKVQTNWCVCLKPGEDNDVASGIWQGDCSDARCDTPLKGTCRYGRFTAGIEQFFFSEQYTRELAVVPPESSIIVSVSRSGKGVVKEMLVGGEPLAKWLESKAAQP
jgi:hypothetical protein